MVPRSQDKQQVLEIWGLGAYTGTGNDAGSLYLRMKGRSWPPYFSALGAAARAVLSW